MAYVATTMWGVPHGIVRAEVLTNWNPGAAGVTTIDVSANVPKGTKAVNFVCRFKSSAVGNAVVIAETGLTAGPFQYSIVANVQVVFTGAVGLDSSYQFDAYANSGNISGVYVYITAVYL